jgi:ATP-dependent protease ClpP protease subunit
MQNLNFYDDISPDPEEEGVRREKQERRILRKERKVCLMSYVHAIASRELIEDFEILISESKDPITVMISSDGGSVSSGLACIREIRKAQSLGIKVIGEVYGHAMSMAFLILECCDHRTMGKLCTLMAHGVTTFTVGDSRNLAAEKKLLEYWQKEFSILLAARCTEKEFLPNGSIFNVGSIEFWEKIFADNCPQFYDSDECIKMGLIDEVL